MIQFLIIFTEAVQTFGCLLRICGDGGTENTKVALHGILDPDDTVELFCSQYIFIPRINVS